MKIGSDLKRLFRDCGFAVESHPLFEGALELGAFAKLHNAASSAAVGLADLVSSVLRRHLPKDPAIRISTLWDSPVLSQPQLAYAALDVYAVWAVYDALLSLPENIPVTADTRGGTPVAIKSQDGTQVVATGLIYPERPKKWDNVAVSKTRVLVQVLSVRVPGYLMPSDVTPSRKPTPLASYGSTPFTALCQSKHVIVSSHESSPSTTPVTVPKAMSSASGQTNVGHTSVTSCPSSPCDDHDSDAMRWHDNIEFDADVEQDFSSSLRDAHAVARAQALPQVSSGSSTTASGPIRTRVLGDIWHGMDQFPISVHHGLRRPFARALRDAMLLPDEDDKLRVEAVLKKFDKSFNSMLLSHSSWILRRVKRFAPAPEELHPRVLEVLQTFGPLKDAKTSAPLFNDTAWDLAANFLENIQRGHFSDPPGVILYYEQGRDKDGLVLYRCVRGTNGVEGGIHQNIIRRFGLFNASPRLALALLHDYCLGHNLEVCYSKY